MTSQATLAGRHMPPRIVPELEHLVRRQLELLDEDPSRDGLARTPERVARSLS